MRPGESPDSRGLLAARGVRAGRPRPGIWHRAGPRKRRVRGPRLRHRGRRIRRGGARPGVRRKRLGFSLRRNSHGLPLKTGLKTEGDSRLDPAALKEQGALRAPGQPGARPARQPHQNG
jgi:hypothetical protein